MDVITKWGEFIGSEEDYKAFVAEMERRENPAPAPEKKVESTAEPKKKTTKKQ